MRNILLLLSLLVAASPLFAQVSPERKIVEVPKPDVPAEAVASGLGGTVRVVVTVDNVGNVISVGNATGPGWICPSVTRPDVVALREAAKAVAANAKFEPSDLPGPASLFVNVEFPSRIEETVAGDTDYTGPVQRVDKVYEKPPGDGNKFTIRGDSRATVKSDDRSEKLVVKGDRDFTASNDPPPDYIGPVATTGTSISKGIQGGVLNGKAVTLPRPPYPPAARAVRASGAVSIQVLIDEDGKIFSAAPVSGHPLLRMAARQAACGAEFTPTLLSGNPVKVSGIIVYNFVP